MIHSTTHANRVRPERLDAKDAASARALGCRCEPDVVPAGSGVCWIIHDWHCPVARSGDRN
jgi:hypothetical protein